MLEIRWHSRAGQGAVTGAKGLGSIVAESGKQVQAFAFYGSAKRGASMTAYNRIDDKVILNHEKYMSPDYVFILDPGLALTDHFTANGKDTTKYIITTHLSKEDLISLVPELQDIKDRVFILDCFQIARDTIGKAIPNTPMLGAFMKVSGMYELDYFKEKMVSVLKKLPPNIIEANMVAIQRAYDEVH